MNHRGFKVVGHRGAAGLAPENTLASLEAAVMAGADEVEFDVRTTKDDIAVLHHDAFILDKSDNKLVIANENYEQLLETKPDLTTFDKAIITIGQTIPMIGEVKPGVKPEPIAGVIKNYLDAGWPREDFLLASFDHNLLRELDQELPSLQKIVNELRDTRKARDRALSLGVGRISLDYRWLTRQSITSISRDGYEIGAYTVNDLEKARVLAGYGLKAIFTDFPNELQAEKITA